MSENRKSKTVRKILVCANTSWYLSNFRSNLIVRLNDLGYETYTTAPLDAYTEKLENIVVRHIELPFSSSSLNPIAELKVIFRIYRILRELKPDVMLNFTAKPNIYGSIACRLLGISVINNIAGLGSGFVKRSFLTKLLKYFYKFAFMKADVLMFQNSDDLTYFIESRVCREEQTVLIPGSGVDLHKYNYIPPVFSPDSKIRFLFVARMLHAKGVMEFLNAAKIILETHAGKAEFFLCGSFDIDNRDAVPRESVSVFEEIEGINIVGHVDNIDYYLTRAHCLVLPSYYREGVPRSLLEGLAVGRIIITTDMPGCRETVVGGNGWLVAPRNTRQLVSVISQVLDMSEADIDRMCRSSRKLAESKFNEELVLSAYHSSISELT